MFDFIVAELRRSEPLCSQRIGPVVRALNNQRDDLLAFAADLDTNLAAVGVEFQMPVETVRDVLNIEALQRENPSRWPREAALREQLGGRFFALSEAVAEVAHRTVRASSIVENFNSRLRNYSTAAPIPIGLRCSATSGLPHLSSLSAAVPPTSPLG